MENKKPLTSEIVERLGDEPQVIGMISDVLDGVKEYRDEALGEWMAGAVAILYGELTRRNYGMSPSDILTLAYDELAQEEEVA